MSDGACLVCPGGGRGSWHQPARRQEQRSEPSQRQHCVASNAAGCLDWLLSAQKEILQQQYELLALAGASSLAPPRTQREKMGRLKEGSNSAIQQFTSRRLLCTVSGNRKKGAMSEGGSSRGNLLLQNCVRNKILQRGGKPREEK